MIHAAVGVTIIIDTTYVHHATWSALNVETRQFMSKVQEEEKRRKRQGNDELELGETSEVYMTRQRAPKRRKTSEILSRHINNATSKSPLGTTGKARFLWTTKTKEAFFEGLCKHGKDFEKICVFMNTKPHLKQVVPSLSRNQVRFFYYRTWKLVSGYYTAANCRQEYGCEPSKPCDSVSSSNPASVAATTTTTLSASVKEDQLTDEESYGDDMHPRAAKRNQPMAAENVVGGAQGMENTAAEEEMFSDEGQATPVATEMEKDELSDNSEHESEDDTEEERSPLETPAEEEPIPSTSADGHRSVQEPSSGGAATLTSKVTVDGKLMPLDLVSLICYGKYRSKLQALGNKAEIGSKLHQLVYSGVTSIRYKGRRMRLKMPLCVALKNDNRSTEQSHDGIVTGGIPDGMDHVILKLTAYNSESWSHIQQLSFNPRLRIVLSNNRTLTSVLKLLIERWNLPELEGRNDVKIFYWPQVGTCDNKEKDWCSGRQLPCNHNNQSAILLTYDSDTTLGEVAMKLQMRNTLELMYDISTLVQKGGVADRMEPLLRVVRLANKNVRSERATVPRVLSRISPRKFGIFGSSFHQRMTAHRIGFGGRGRVKLDFSSPKKDDVTAPIPPPPPNTLATPTKEESYSPTSKGVDIIIQTPLDGTPDKTQTQTPKTTQLQQHKNGVKSKRNIKRNRIVTFDEHQLNQSGSFSNIPIKNLMMLAQQQVASFRSPKKDNTTPPSFSPPETPSPASQQPRSLNMVTAVTIPTNHLPPSTMVAVSANSLPVTSTATVQQQDVDRARSHTHTISVTTTTTTPAPSPVPATITTTRPAQQLDTIVPHPPIPHPAPPVPAIPHPVAMPAPAPVQTRPARIQARIQARPIVSPIVSQRSLVPQPLSFFTSATSNTSIASNTNGTSQLLNHNSSDDGGTQASMVEAVKQKTSVPAGKPLNIQNLTIVQQIQLLALIQQYQTMQRPKSTTPQKTTPQSNTDKLPGTSHQQPSSESLQKQSTMSSVAVAESSEVDEELYKLLHAAPIKTPKRQNQLPVSALPADEVSSDTVNNLLSSLMKSKQSDKQQQDLARLASETADLLPTFTAGLLQGKTSGKDDLVQEVINPTAPSDTLPSDLLPGSSGALNRNVAMDTLPSFDSDSSNHFGLFNLDNLLEDPDASLGAFLAYLESPKKKGPPNNSILPDLFCSEQDSAHHSNSSEEFSFQALLEENSQDLSNKFRELSGLLMQQQQSDAPTPFNT